MKSVRKNSLHVNWGWIPSCLYKSKICKEKDFDFVSVNKYWKYSESARQVDGDLISLKNFNWNWNDD